MKSIKSKGFTLIEILAVFVVLAILALIAVPVISNIIKSADKQSFKVGMENIRDASQFYVERAILREEMSIDSCVYFSFDEDVAEITQKEKNGELRTYVPISYLELKGDLPTSGEIKACGETIEINVSDGQFSGSMTDDEFNIVEGDNIASADVTTPVIREIRVNRATTSYLQVAVDAYNPNETGEIVYYYYSLDGENYERSTSNTHEFTSLEKNTEYTIYVKVENKGGKVGTKTLKTKTSNFDDIYFVVSPKEWSSTKTVVIEGETEGATIQYRILKYDEATGQNIITDWAPYSGILYLDTMATEEHPTIIYARFVDDKNVSDEKTYSITKIDTTGPKITTNIVSTTTNSISISFIAIDNESDIASVSCQYGPEYSMRGTIEGNKCIISGLNPDTEHLFRIVATNNVNISDEFYSTATTVNFPEIDIEVTPSDWSDSKTVELNGEVAGATLEYKIRKYNESTLVLEETDFIEYTGPFTLDTFATATYPTTVIVRFNDGDTTSQEKSIVITKIDTKAPVITVDSIKTSTKTIAILYTLSDADSSVVSYSCEYGTTTKYGTKGTSTATSCILDNLETGKTYYYKITAVDEANNDAKYESSTATGTTAVLFDVTQTPENTDYATSKDLVINYTVDKVSNPAYYFKATTSTTVGNEVYACENDTNGQPSKCSSNGTTSISANTWYLSKSAIINANFKDNGTVYAMIHDGNEYLTASTFIISQIDTSEPNLTIGEVVSTTSSITIPFTAEDAESGILSTTCEYGTSKSYGQKGEIKDGKCYLRSLDNDSLYYYKIEVVNGAGTSVKEEMSSKPGTFGICSITIEDTLESSNWSIDKTVTISGTTTGADLQYGYSSSGPWTNIESGDTVNLKEPKTVYCRFYDGTNESGHSSFIVSKVDSSIPTDVDFSYSTTTSSITVTASATDDESGIAGYQFSSDGGKTWTNFQIENKYKFENLKSGSYSVVVKAINGTKTVNGVIAENSGLSSARSISPDKIGECSVTLDPESGWASSKVATITGSANGATLQYSVGNTKDWVSVISGTKVPLNQAASPSNILTVYCQITDFTNTGNTGQASTAQIDPTGPTSASFSYSTTTSSISIIAAGTDAESGIYGYQFSSDGGKTWTDIQTSNSYTFSGLKSGSYSIAIKAVNGTYVNEGITDTNYITYSETVKTKDIPKCTIKFNPESDWSISKTATISGSVEGADLQYSYSASGPWSNISSGSNIDITNVATATNPVTVYCRFYDGVNEDGGSSSSTTTVDPTAPTTLTFSYVQTTSAIKLIADASDDESGIYGYQFSKDGGKTWTDIQTSNEYTFGSLKSGTYTMAIKAVNGTYVSNGIKAENSIVKTIDLTPEPLTQCQIDITPGGWSTSKTATITGTATGANLQYKTKIYNFTTGKYVETEFTTITSGTTIPLNTAATSAYPTTVYCQLTDGTNTLEGESKTIMNGIDPTPPTIKIDSVNSKTDRIELVATCTDDESGVTKYEFSSNGGSTWDNAGTTNSYTYSGLTQGTTYSSFMARCTNGTNVTSDAVDANGKTATITAPSWNIPDGWSTSKTVTVTYNSTNVVSPVYFLKSNVTGKTNVALTTCSTSASVTPKTKSECTGTVIAANGNISTNTWYMVNSGATASITVGANGDLYAVTSDGTNTKTSSAASIRKIDLTKPTTTAPVVVSTSTNSIIVGSSQTDSESDINTSTLQYGISTDNSTYTWQSSNQFTGLNDGTKYYVKTRVNNNAGTGLTTSVAKEVTTGDLNIANNIVCGYDPEGVAKSKTVTLTSNVAGATIKYSYSSGGSFQTYTSGIPVTENLIIYAVLTDGTNTSDEKTCTVAGIDNEKPDVPTSVIRYGSSTGTVRTNANTWSNQTLWWGGFSAEDNGVAGIDHYEYSTGCTGTKSGNLSSSHTYTNGTNYTFCIRAVDKAENYSDWSSAYYFKVDTQAPNTPTSVIRYGSSTGTVRTNANTWSSQALWWGTFSATDNGISNINRYEFSTNCTGTVNGTLSTSGYTYGNGTNYTFCIRSVDNALNYSAWSSAYYFKVDTSGPTNTQPSVAAVSSNPTSQAIVTNKQTDTGSNITSVQYGKATSASGTYSWQTSNTFTGLQAGTPYYFKTKATNGAGTTVESSYTAYTPAKTGTCTVAAKSGTPTYATSKTYTITSANVPNGAKLQYKINSGSWTDISSGYEYTSSNNGTVITCQLVDNAATTLASHSYTVSGIDNGYPSVSASISNSNWTNANVTLTASPSGSNSGYSYQWYRIAGYASGATSGTAISGATKSTYTTTNSSTGYYSYYVVVTTGIGRTATSNLVFHKYDVTKPSCSFTGENTSWTKNDVTIRATCSDANAGCTTATEYKTWSYAGATADSTVPLSYTITDNAGNSNTCSTSGMLGRNANVYHDEALPTCAISGTSTTWRSSATIRIYCGSDSGSGCNTSYSNSWSYGSSSNAKTASLSYTIYDNVGNARTCSYTADVYVDTVAPKITHSPKSGNPAGVTVSVSDTSGAASISVKYGLTLSNGSCSPVIEASQGSGLYYFGSTSGKYCYVIKVTDNAGYSSTASGYATRT